LARGVLAGAGCRCHWQSRCLHKPGAYRALGRLARKGSRDRAGPQSACQRTRAPALCGASRVGTPMGRGCNMQARQTPSPASRLDRVRRRSGCNDSRPDRISLQEGTCSGINEAQHPVADNNSYVVRWSVCSNHEDALPQVWVTAVMLAWLSSGQS
jgi:hypothetical protein